MGWGERARTARRCALAATVAAVVAAGLLAASGATGRPGEYLSQLGTPDAPTALLYRGAVAAASLGVLLVAASIRLGGAGRLEPSGVALVRVGRAVGIAGAVWLLVGTAAGFATSGAVPCSPGCPMLPHDDGVTAADLVHFVGAAVGFACAVLAMLVLAAAHPDRTVRRVSLVAAAVCAPTAVGTLVALLISSHGVANGLLERVATAGALVWLVVVGGRLSRRQRTLAAASSV